VGRLRFPWCCSLRLVNIQWTETTLAGTYALFWSLTPYGDRLMMELRTVKKVKALDKMLDQPQADKEAK
jgi:hypothetical protein